jgi:hypothetical protein
MGPKPNFTSFADIEDTASPKPRQRTMRIW